MLFVMILIAMMAVVVHSIEETYTDPRPSIYLAQDVFLKMNTISGSNEFYMDIWMPTNHYVAISFGGTHINSDMIVFVTNTGSDSLVYDMYSSEFGEPKFDDELVTTGDIEVREILAEYPLVKFSIARKLETRDAHDYIVQLEEVIEVGFAVRDDDILSRNSDGSIQEFGSHQRHGFFNMILFKDETTSYWGIYAEGAV